MSGNAPTPLPGSGQPRRGDDDPFLALRRGVDRLFDQVVGGWGLGGGGLPAPFASTGLLSPKVDVAETPAGLEVTADLPGIDPKDVALELEDGVLTIRAERKQERKEEDKDRRWHIVERHSGTFLRRFALPFEPETDKVEARFDKGVLHVSIPRPAQARPQSRRIEIKGG